MSKGLVDGVNLEVSSEASTCASESCEWAKGSRKTIIRCVAVSDEIHSDIWGPVPVETIGRKQYYVSFIDDLTPDTPTFNFLQTKDETFESYCIYEAWLSTNAQIKCLNSNRGGEYLSKDFSEHLQKTGTTRRVTVHRASYGLLSLLLYMLSSCQQGSTTPCCLDFLAHHVDGRH